MPKFHVLCRIDAFADYVAEVVADDADEAALLAQEQDSKYVWVADGVQEFDARLYVTLRENGSPNEKTQIGDF